jgi:hypothetical protein
MLSAETDQSMPKGNGDYQTLAKRLANGVRELQGESSIIALPIRG